MKHKRILIGITGGIAAYKIPELIRLLVKAGHEVKTVMTEAGAKFVTRVTLETVSASRVYTDMFESGLNTEPVHIALARWADAVVVAPATADIIAKTAIGSADNFLSSILLASKKPLFFCPSMNTAMYQHPATVLNLRTLQARGVNILPPESGLLASASEGEGIGRMPEPQTIFEWLTAELEAPVKDFRGLNIIVTGGPTREHIDPVRYISNRSSGKMGCELASAAARRGGTVTLVHGPISIPLPAGVNCVQVLTVDQMFNAVRERYDDADVVIMAAAAADYKTSEQSPLKIKKSGGLNLKLIPAVDILKWLGEYKKNQYLAGFALEDSDEINNARKKLEEKNLNLIILNGPEAMDSEHNRITLIGRDSAESLPMLSKKEAAARILNRISQEIKRKDG
ncbi:bifunctional phosphopantothenoylcysteine decarboxylase/phosphopantothenate--cysteine ligase CoaBC [bacterium]|nr:bifunctional phosphopantothenoylcysteine decarboxylase/phosphopantothenate--cysteine ligase CoaBC [FCB group bacterium]MBL7190418.1 bifunctional phosphopantothenoylcysteine decarboxylase/phosphopantothenate--cysteine ligase CoaBC [bacterium]